MIKTIKKAEWKNVLKQGQKIVLTTIDKDGKPNAIVVVSLGLVDGKLLIANCQMKSTFYNIQNNPNICIVSTGKKEYYRIKGVAFVFSNGKFFDAAVKKSSPKPPVKAAIVIDIKEVFDLDKMVVITPKVKKIIEENPVAFATVSVGGVPNVIPVACVKVVSKNQVIVTDNFMKHTKENLEKNDNVCLAVWNDKEEGYKLIGRAEYFASGKWLEFVKQMQENKGLPAKGAIVVTVSKLIELGG